MATEKLSDATGKIIDIRSVRPPIGKGPIECQAKKILRYASSDRPLLPEEETGPIGKIRDILRAATPRAKSSRENKEDHYDK